MAKGGKREGAGRPPKADPALFDTNGPLKPGPIVAADRACYGRILEALNEKPADKDTKEVARWRELVDAQDIRVRLDALKYLYDKRDGKAIQPVDVDATLEGNVTIHLGGLMPKEFRDQSRK